ncbi:Peptidyl-tRNA hydrolase [uncultured Desulfobacterium sp.]|uniref:Peptidyl-tRNA hydrolase n=1 Tax=uncultured Desulfobacterium sp. TaxID=201089 RepID=A0A445MUR1_9BACT|nr:Peptidyl-tRNA hydrolase [uncultured Desulfobacterium sp.]
MKGGEGQTTKPCLIVGLGNPGSEYENSRHNVGFMAIDLMCNALGIRLSGRSFQSNSAHTRIQDKKVMVLCPLTFMNRSGAAVKACAEYYSIEPKDILVIHDDIDLMVGRVRVSRDSGSGGHKGVQSIIDYLGSKCFCRVKIGIGRPRYGEPVEDYVLSPFYKDEREHIAEALRVALQACELFVLEGIEPAMNNINRLNRANKEES